jgi:hypothetical protein
MARKRKPTDTVALQVRMPEALRHELEAAAQKANRSLNSEVLWRLGQTFGDEWQRFIAGVETREKKAQEIRDRVLQDPELEKFLTKLVAPLIEKYGSKE